MRKTLTILLAAAALALVVVGNQTSNAIAAPAAKARTHHAPRCVVMNPIVLGPVDDVIDFVRKQYVDKPDDQKLVTSAIDGVLHSLDPHSRRLDAKEWKEMWEEVTNHGFGGIGVDVMQEGGLIKVVEPTENGPAAHAGILPGDRIIAIDGASTQEMSLKEAVDKMRGAINTSVKLRILRDDKSKMEFNIVRAAIYPKSVRSRIQDGNIAYIRISHFNADTAEGLKAAIMKYQYEIPDDAFKGYILDLRNNPGGLVDQSIWISAAFIEDGEIVSTRGREGVVRYRVTPNEVNAATRGKPLVVLINGGSASASEIVAGALQDHKRATLIGTRSFGKDSVQRQIPLGPGQGGILLTTSRYYTPSGRSIQAKGIEPDMEVLQDVPDELKGQDAPKGEASLEGHLKNGNDEKSGSQTYVPTDPKQDKAFIAAVTLLRGETKWISPSR